MALDLEYYDKQKHRLDKGICWYNKCPYQPNFVGFMIYGYSNLKIHYRLAQIGIRHNQAYWFEAHTAYCGVVLSFPYLFSAEIQQQAKETLKEWYPYIYQHLFNCRLKPSDSHILKRDRFYEEHKDSYIGICSWRIFHNNMPTNRLKVLAFRPLDQDYQYFITDDSYYDSSKIMEGKPVNDFQTW